tara:strand:- start:849 stop:1049 length:201 start_codon:yes stop_codon:yes gene_type:complete
LDDGIESAVTGPSKIAIFRQKLAISGRNALRLARFSLQLGTILPDRYFGNTHDKDNHRVPSRINQN